jgi:hypothetical protein
MLSFCGSELLLRLAETTNRFRFLARRNSGGTVVVCGGEVSHRDELNSLPIGRGTSPRRELVLDRRTVELRDHRGRYVSGPQLT